MSTVSTDFQWDSDAWKPGERCRRWLLAGALGALLQGLFFAAGTVYDLVRPGDDTAILLLTLVSVAPQVVVLPAFLKLAREASSRALWKSSFGVYAATWIMILLAPVPLELVGRAPASALTVIGIGGLVALVVFTFSKLPRFGVPETGGKGPGVPDAEGSGCANHLWWLVGLGILRRFFRRGAMPNGGPFTFVVGVLIATALVWGCYFIWSAVAKIRLRERLGGTALLLGAVELVITASYVGLIGLGIAALSNAAAAGMNEAEIEKLIATWDRPSTLVIGISSVTWCLATALFFWSVRRRGEPDWREQFFNMGADPRYIQR